MTVILHLDLHLKEITPYKINSIGELFTIKQNNFL
jgi:hypothetical protein